VLVAAVAVGRVLCLLRLLRLAAFDSAIGRSIQHLRARDGLGERACRLARGG
jgi:hypothetical protein